MIILKDSAVTVKPSHNHSNRGRKNWLIYDIGDRFLEKHSDCYKGVMYDLGCGEAPYREYFLQYVDKYVGVDWGGSLHNSKKEVCADLNKALPIESEIADTVVSLSVLEHLCEPQVMLNESFRILRPKGNLVLQVPWQWWIHEAPYDFYRYTKFGLEYMLSKAGYVDIIVEPQGGFFTMWILKFNYFSSRLICGPQRLRSLVMLALWPFWFLGQKLAPILDRFDKSPDLESYGYFVVAKKL